MNKTVKPMADPIIPLLDMQRALNNGEFIVPSELDEGYLPMYDEVPSGKRYSYAKIVNNEVQVVAILGAEDPINGIACFSLGYAVSEKHRGRKLSIEAVNKGLEDLKRILNLTTSIKQFYLEALVATTNTPSIKIAEKLFSSIGIPMDDTESGTPSRFFHKLINIS